MAAIAGNGVGIAGVAPNARILPLKFMAGGTGRTSSAIEAIAYAMGNRARIVSASWGSTQESPALCDAVAAARAGGTLVVAAAGNTVPILQRPPLPRVLSGALAVAATDGNDRIAPYSNRGEPVRIAAPGDNVVSTAPGAGVEWMSGTSMAVPQVAGVAALAWGVAPGATLDAVEGALIAGADGAQPLRPLPRLNATGTVSLLRAAVSGASVRLDIVRPPDRGSVVLAPGSRRVWVRVTGAAVPAELVVTLGRRALHVPTAALPSRPSGAAGSVELGDHLPRLAVGAREVDVTAQGAERSVTVVVHELEYPAARAARRRAGPGPACRAAALARRRPRRRADALSRARQRHARRRDAQALAGAAPTAQGRERAGRRPRARRAADPGAPCGRCGVRAELPERYRSAHARRLRLTRNTLCGS